MASNETLRQSILKEFFDRDLPAPGAFRMRRLMWEVRNGRTLESIGDGLDSYLQGQFQRPEAH